jgi:predicted ATPase/transcriptional regulator with XRE-family HTH domain
MQGEAAMHDREHKQGNPGAFGALLRRYRTAAGLTQEALAERAGLSARGISDLEREIIRTPRRDTLQLLLDALALPVEEEAILRATAQRGVAEPAAKAEWWGDARLPDPPVPLFGRDQEVSNVVARLAEAGGRWITLTGPGGVGKTSLALAVAQRVATEGASSVTWVGLAPIRDPSLVLPTVANALGIPEAPGIPVADRIAAAIGDRDFLLIVDNLEQIAVAAPALSNLLGACPGLRILATSRTRLRVRAEHLVPVAPLALPSADPSRARPTALAANPAVALFTARTTAVRPEFVLDDDNADQVAAICQRLDGLPLAIELAAARSGLLDPETLLQYLEQGLPLLSQGYADASERHHSMRDTVAWSHDLLPARAQVLFRRLGVFDGGFDLDAFAGVTHRLESAAAAGPDVLPSPDLLDLLQHLVDASLVQRQPHVHGQQRFRMLETVREFAAERLAASGEERAARRAHAEYFAAFADARIRFPEFLEEHPAHFVRIDADVPNLRGALAWVDRHGSPLTGLFLATGLGVVASTLGYLEEASTWLDRFLEDAGTAPTDVHMRALVARGYVRLNLGRDADAIADAESALKLDVEGNSVIGGVALILRASVRRSKAEVEAVIAAYRNDPHGRLVVVFALIALSILSDSVASDGERATAYLEEGLALLGPGPSVGKALIAGNLASLELDRGNIRGAADVRRQSLRWDREGRLRSNLVIDLRSASEIVLAFGLLIPATRLLGASAAIQELVGRVEHWFNEETLLEHTRSLRTALGDDGFDTAFTAGKSLTLDQALDEALDLLDHIAEAEE